MPFERRVERLPVQHGVAGSAVPAGVSAAAVAEASDVTDEDLAGAERVAVRASRRRVRNPLPSGGLYELAKHAYKPKPESVDQ